MRIPVIKGLIKRRLLINFRAEPACVQKLLPQPFTPKLHDGHAVVGVCLIRLEQIRPLGLPSLIGISSENAAHRIAVQWNDPAGARHEGVFIPRRDTGSFLNRVAGGRLFPGEHHPATFSVADVHGHIELSMRSLDGSVTLRVVGDDSDCWPATSCFRSLTEASEFFEKGSLGYSSTHDAHRLDGLLLRTEGWRLRALSVKEVASSFFSDPQKFPSGSILFDHALVMRDLNHEWHKAEDLYTLMPGAHSPSTAT
ncbi:MAG: hypothetical protein C5B50_16655 [Verrucomicrobia bacterium]|nr:MAG: hypothetical protein C5B50_16655 [Verrucomicrobiota bacterium]